MIVLLMPDMVWLIIYFWRNCSGKIKIIVKSKPINFLTVQFLAHTVHDVLIGYSLVLHAPINYLNVSAIKFMRWKGWHVNFLYLRVRMLLLILTLLILKSWLSHLRKAVNFFRCYTAKAIILFKANIQYSTMCSVADPDPDFFGRIRMSGPDSDTKPGLNKWPNLNLFGV
jgi:hypothetical protein